MKNIQNTMTNIRSFGAYSPKIGNDVFIDPSAVISGKVVLADDVSIWPLVSIRGDLELIAIGRRSNIQDNSVIHTTRRNRTYPEGFPVTIGEDVTVGHSVTLHGCTLHDRILVGMGAIILDGALIESDIIIGAGSLVPPGKHLESGFLYVGSPVKKVRQLTEEERHFLKQSAQNYIETKNEHLEASKSW